MTGATWAEIASEAILHTLVASLFVEALVRSWRVREPAQRMALRTVALGYPLVVFPALFLAFPLRRAVEFREDRALFAGERWDAFAVGGAGAWEVVALVLAAMGAALLLLDLVPLLRRRRAAPASGDPEAAARVAALLPPLAAALGTRAPPVVFLDDAAPVLFCTGVRHHAIVISRGTLALLDPAELRAALAHELAHLARHDPAASWAAMGARAILFFNPAFQVLSRALARDVEWLADDRAAAACGDRLALASGLLKLHRATSGVRRPMGRTLPFAPALSEPIAQLRDHEIEVRCRRLLDPPAPALPWGPARVALAGAAVTTLLFFVV